jgi:hypothetical protein
MRGDIDAVVGRSVSVQSVNNIPVHFRVYPTARTVSRINVTGAYKRKKKIKSLCLINEAQRHEDVRGRGGITSTFFNLGNR